MDAYTGPPLAAVYDLADGLPVGSDASKVIAVPMVAKETRIQVDTPLGQISAERYQFAVGPAKATTLHLTQGANAKTGFIMAPASSGHDNFVDALNYVGISRPPDERKFIALNESFTPKMFVRRPASSEMIVDEYARLRRLAGQPAESRALPDLTPPPATYAVVT